MTTAATLTFDDEFNSLNLWNGASGAWDTTAQYATWNGSGFSLPSNGEQEWYINSNYAPTASVQPWSVNNGVMTLTAAPASAAVSSLIGGYQYTSGSINTAQSFSQTYGYFEMHAQLPAGQGLWPAFWLLPENGSWPPEIDAMELLGNNPSVYYTSIHSGTASNEVNAGQADGVGDMSTGYHTYGVDWEPDFITYYFDGQQVFKVATPADMNVPMYMIANLAVGGGWPGNADATTPFPANMNIDWIRAYSSLPSWVADGSDPTDVNHTPAGAIGSTGDTGAASGSVANPAADWMPTYNVASGVTNVILTGTSAQTITANNLGDTITSNDFGSTLIGGTGNDTFIAGHGADTMTSGAGSDTFTFNFTPWNAGHITDFNPAADKLDLTGIFKTIGYTGTNPVADGYLSFVSDGAGNTQVYVNPHSASQSWPSLITTLNGVSSSSITAADYLFGASSGTGTTATSGTTIESFGSTSLVQSGGHYFMEPVAGGAGPELSYHGSVVTAGQFGAGWAPIGAEVTSTGYEVAWQNGSASQFTIWQTDSSGNYLSDTGALTGSSNALETAETSFHQDLNHDGTIGVPGGGGVSGTTIESFGSTSLVQSGGHYFMEPVAGGAGPELSYHGSAVAAGQFGAGWTPIGAEVTSTGYEVAWQNGSASQFTIWQTDSSGNYVSDTGALTGTSNTLEMAETSFHQDLNGDGTLGGPTSADGTPTTATPGAPPVTTSAAIYAVPAGVTNVTLTGTSSQTVTANNLGDTITSNDYASTIVGGSGADTLIAGHGADQLTGGAGSDTFVFNVLPWSAGHITDFSTSQDVLNLTGLLKAVGYSGVNSVADGYLSFVADGAGDTAVYVNPHTAANPWPNLVTTLDHVSPASIAAQDYIV